MALSIEVDARDLEKFAAEMKRVNMLQSVREILRGVSFAKERQIKEWMPARTGRARASWGHWTPGNIKRSARGNASAADAIWREEDKGLAITQGSNVEYIPYLEAGHSRQAPAGFIAKAQSRAEFVLAAALGDIDPLDPKMALKAKIIFSFVTMPGT